MASPRVATRREQGQVSRPGLTLTEAAAATGVHRSTIRRYLDARKLPNAYREDTPEGPGPWRVPVDDLVAAGLRPELGAGDPAPMAPGRRDALPELEYWRRRAEVAEAVAAERERALDDLRATLEVLRDALRAVGGREGTESSPRRPRRS